MLDTKSPICHWNSMTEHTLVSAFLICHWKSVSILSTDTDLTPRFQWQKNHWRLLPIIGVRPPPFNHCIKMAYSYYFFQRQIDIVQPPNLVYWRSICHRNLGDKIGWQRPYGHCFYPICHRNGQWQKGVFSTSVSTWHKYLISKY